MYAKNVCREFMLKIEILIKKNNLSPKNQNFSQKSKFWPNIEISVRNRKFKFPTVYNGISFYTLTCPRKNIQNVTN